MSLPIVVLPTHEKWDCHQCGACCRSSLVLLNEEDIEKLKSQKWDERDPFRNSPIITRTRFPKRSYRLAQKADGSCVFLDSIGHCRIHLEFGADAKPTVCRNFPMQLVPREGKAVLTVRRSCPSAADDNGLPLKQFLSSTQKQVREGKMSCKEISPPALKSGERHHWKIVSHALNVVADLLQDPRFPPVRRLVHALQFAKLLALAKTKAMAEEKLVALLDTLAQVVPEESKQFFDERRQPGAYANILFRSIGVEYARLHPHCRAHRNWAHRASMAGTLFRLV